MRFTRIDLEGQRDHFAVISRKRGTNWVNIKLMTPTSQRERSVPADNQAEQWHAAVDIQFELDGHRGTNSMIHDYLRVIGYLGD